VAYALDTFSLGSYSRQWSEGGDRHFLGLCKWLLASATVVSLCSKVSWLQHLDVPDAVVSHADHPAVSQHRDLQMLRKWCVLKTSADELTSMKMHNAQDIDPITPSGILFCKVRLYLHLGICDV
jgi:hypothetical protein